MIFVYSLDHISTCGDYKFERKKKEINIYKKFKDDYELQKTIDLLALRDKLKTLKKTKDEIKLDDLQIEAKKKMEEVQQLYVNYRKNIL